MTDDGGAGGKIQTLQVTKTAGVTTCSPKGGCAFNIEVRNDTTEAIAGPIVIDEQIDALQATMTGEPNAPWTCTKAAPFTCTHPGPVPANGALDMRVVFAPNTPAEQKELKNCVAMVGRPAPGAEANVPPVGPAAAAPACATIALDPNAPVQSGPVIVAKKGAGKCTAKGPCAFTITLQNTLEINTGEFLVNEIIDAPQATLVGEPNAPWTCTKTAPFTCKHPGLAAKSTTELQLSFTPNTPPEKKELKNCAVPTSFTGGKALPPGQQNQIAPGKRTNLFEPRRFALGPQSFAPNKGLLHLTGGTGNIGGVTNNCLERAMPADFSVQQSSGHKVFFSELKVTNGTVSGRAIAVGSASQVGFFSIGGEQVLGRVEGSYSAVAHQAKLKVFWDNGAIGVYLMTIADDGSISGTTIHENGPGKPQAALSNVPGQKKSWACSRNEICDKYAKAATDAASKFNQFKCGPDAPPGRWSTDANSHLNWCMGEPANSPFVNSETQARSQGLAACIENRRQFCSLVEIAAQKKGEEFLKRGCETNLFSPGLTDAEFRKNVCMQNDQAAQLKVVEVQDQMLNDCIAKQAAAGGGAGGGAAGGAGGGVGLEVDPDKLPPEQCAVVPIEPDAKPGEGPVAELPGGGGGKVEPSQASKAGTLSLVKTAAPGSCKDNRKCDFTVEVTNTAAQPFDGQVEFTDDLTGDGALFGASTISAPQPWACPKVGGNFACAGMLALAATEKKSFAFTADLGAGIGEVKEMKNCATLKGAPAPSCATAPLAQVQPPPAPPSADPNGLVLTKRRAADKCSDLGGGCAFIVRITNSSQAEFNGPIEFTDVIKTADGQALPNATLEAQPLVTLDEGAAAAITCTKAGDTVTCGTGGANAKIPPGKFVDAKLTMKPGPAGGATAVRNCALLKSGGGQSCSNMALVNGPLVRLTKFGGGDTCLPRCTFAVVIQNVGNVDAKGSFKFKDTFTPASSLGGFDTLPQGGECSRGGDELFCVPNVKVLKPGELTTVTVTVFGKAKAPEYTNCVDLVPQPQAPKESLVLDTSNQGRCVTVKDTSPQTPNLVIRKQAPNRKDGSSDGHCDLKSACRFTITVTNNGLAPFTGPLRVTDKVSLGIPQFISIGPGSPQSLPWKCDSVQNGGAIAQSSIKCELPPLPNGLAPGTTATLEVSVTPGTTWKGSDRLKNCAEITSDGDIGANAQKEDCAEVVLDPFNVKVAKTGDQACAPGSDCHFKISLFNPGPIDHNAPVTITDKLTGLSSAQIVSITPPLPCAAQPTQIPFTCTSPGNVRLDLDAKPGDIVDGVDVGPRDYTMVVRLPNDATAASFSNCASVAADANSPAGEEACATVSTKPVAAATPAGVLTIAKTAVSPSCDETAPCAYKITVTNTSGQVYPGPIVVDDLMSAGDVPMTQYRLAGPTAPWTCIASAAPGMQCSHPGPLAINASLDLPLALQPLPGSLGTASEVKNCAHLAALRVSAGNACASIPVKKASPTPPPGTLSCIGDLVLTAGGLCACPPAMEFKNGKCVGQGGISTTPGSPSPVVTPPPGTLSCLGDLVLTAGGLCACPPAMEFKNGKCVGQGGINTTPRPSDDDTPAQPPKNRCPNNSTFKNGGCVCDAGYVVVRRRCVPAAVTQPQPEKKKETGTTKCRKGLHLEDGACVPDEVTKPEPVKCPDGTIFLNGKCRRLSIPTPTQPRPEPQKPQPRDCGPGYRVLDKPNRYGNYCEEIQKKCPSGYTGTWPDCKPLPVVYPPCPAGWSGTPGNCKPPVTKPAPQPQQPPPPQMKPCPKGWDGDFFPNCSKPPS